MFWFSQKSRGKVCTNSSVLIKVVHTHRIERLEPGVQDVTLTDGEAGEGQRPHTQTDKQSIDMQITWQGAPEMGSGWV